MRKDHLFKKFSLILFAFAGVVALSEGVFSNLDNMFYPIFILGIGSYFFSIYNNLIDNSRLNIIEYFGVLVYFVSFLVSFSGYSYWYYTIAFLTTSCVVMYFSYKRRAIKL